MTIIPELLRPLIQPMAEAFTRPTFKRFLTLMAAAILNTGRRTVSNLLRTAGGLAPGDPSSYHSVFSRRRWSTWSLARALAGAVLRRFAPDRPVPLAGDDTVDEHRGEKVYGKGRHRDPVRSTHSYTAWRWGHKWVVLAVLVKFPFASRPWALPVLVALYRTPEWDREHGRRHKTPCELMRQLLAVLIHWFPGPAVRLRRRRRLRDARPGPIRPPPPPSSDPGQPVLPRRPVVRARPGGRRQAAGPPAPQEGGKLPTPQEVVATTRPDGPGRLLVRRRAPGHRGGLRLGPLAQVGQGAGPGPLGVRARQDRDAPRRVLLQHRRRDGPGVDRRGVHGPLVDRDDLPGDAAVPGPGDDAGVDRVDGAAGGAVPVRSVLGGRLERTSGCGRAAGRRRGSAGRGRWRRPSPTRSRR